MKKKARNLALDTMDIKIEIKNIVLGLCNEDVKDIEFDQDLYSVGINSIDRIRIIVEIEKLYDLEIEEEDYVEKNFTCINAIWRMVNKNLNAKGAWK